MFTQPYSEATEMCRELGSLLAILDLSFLLVGVEYIQPRQDCSFALCQTLWGLD